MQIVQHKPTQMVNEIKEYKAKTKTCFLNKGIKQHFDRLSCFSWHFIAQYNRLALLEDVADGRANYLISSSGGR